MAIRALLLGELPRPPESGWDLHKNHIYFQEFLPENQFDTRITVIGRRAFGFRRLNRPNDFRASGSGRIDWDPQGIDQGSIVLGFEVAARLGTQSVALDVLRKEDRQVVSEISYTYASWGVHGCPGHWEIRDDTDPGALVWKPGQMWPEEAQIADFLALLERRAENAMARAPSALRPTNTVGS